MLLNHFIQSLTVALSILSYWQRRFHHAGHDVLIYTRRAKASYPRDEVVSGCPVIRVGLDDRYGMIGRYLGMLTILPPLIIQRHQYDVVSDCGSTNSGCASCGPDEITEIRDA